MKSRVKEYQWHIEWREPSELKPYEYNAKLHDEKQVKNIANSIKKFGWQQPGVVTNDDVLIIGHGRRLAALMLKSKMPVKVIEDDLTDDEIKELRLADNLTNESGWDFDLRAFDAANLDFEGFDFDLDFGESTGDAAQEVVEDEVPEPPKEPISKRGDIWQLGRHRLMCGDSTSESDVAALMNGEKADIVFTDPPYNIASDSKNFAADCSKAMETLAEAEWDKDFDIKPSLKNILNAISENASVYICTSHFLAGLIWGWMKEWADHYSYCVWSKPNPMPSLSKRHWTWNTELICYATRGKHIFNFPEEGHALSTWVINKRNGDTGHPTEKPVEVPANAITHSSNRECAVLDLFGGSGSTLIACEQLNRKCFMMELDPKYCDVIIQRWENLTGEKAELLNG